MNRNIKFKECPSAWIFIHFCIDCSLNWFSLSVLSLIRAGMDQEQIESTRAIGLNKINRICNR